MELRFQPGLGAGLLGPAAAGDRRRPGQPGRLGGQLRPGAGHHAGRHRPELRGDPHRPGADPPLAEQRRGAAGRLDFIDAGFQAGFKVSELDLDQAKSNLAQTEAQILPLEIECRQASNRLCTLMGIPAIDLQYLLGTGPIPTAPPEVAVGIPAELLRRRPDVRQAERLAAAQAEQIGIAEAQLYPMFSINGMIDWQATKFRTCSPARVQRRIGPPFQWNILNYGRIHNNVLYQDAL